MKNKKDMITKRICERCGKVERSKTKFTSPLCRECQKYLGNIKSQEKRRANHKCQNCGKKAKAMRCPHCRKIIKWYNRCEKCLSKSRRTKIKGD